MITWGAQKRALSCCRPAAALTVKPGGSTRQDALCGGCSLRSHRCRGVDCERKARRGRRREGAVGVWRTRSTNVTDNFIACTTTTTTTGATTTTSTVLPVQKHVAADCRASGRPCWTAHTRREGCADDAWWCCVEFACTWNREAWCRPTHLGLVAALACCLTYQLALWLLWAVHSVAVSAAQSSACCSSGGAQARRVAPARLNIYAVLPDPGTCAR
jgi:hypothetical protein